MRKQKWTLEQQAMLAAMSDQGMSAVRIAAEIGESAGAVNRAMCRYGLFARSKPRRQKTISLIPVGASTRVSV